tara:strand:- start:546 stop:782 length:237 start_codon:yes stop_codon:yes gene_type:complete
MNIDDKILDEQRRYIGSTGRHANYIYVGDNEFQEMMDSELMQLNAKYYDKETKLIGGRFFAGMKVIRVQQSNHFNIAT